MALFMTGARKYFFLLCMLIMLVMLSTLLYKSDNGKLIQMQNKPGICKHIREASEFCTVEITRYFPLLAKYGLNNPPTSRDLPVIVTGADSSHYLESQGCIKTLDEKLRPEYPDFKLIYYDLGLKSNEREQKHCGCEVRSFPFSMYPSHVRQLNNYAFKPIIVSTVIQEYDIVWWMDASIRITDGNISNVLKQLGDDCVSAFSPYTHPQPGSHVWRTSPLMFQFFNVTPADYLSFTEFMGGLLMFKNSCGGLADFVIKLWTSCALVKDCISPPGAKLQCPTINKNVTAKDVGRCHRYDQSLLNILLWKLKPDSIYRALPHWVKIVWNEKVHYFPNN